MLKYIEQCTGTNHNGPAWIAYVKQSKTGRTLYFNGMALRQSSHGGGAGNYYDTETGDEYWVSGVKKDGSDRHWAGSGCVTVEAAALDEYLAFRGLSSLPVSQYTVSSEIEDTDIAGHHAEENEPCRE